jgi:PTS system mannose-specific IIB component
MSVSLVRVDSRLMHGQIVTAWVPSLRIDLVLVADDEVLADEFERELMRSTAPPGLDVEVCGLDEVGQRIARAGARRVLVLFRAVQTALAARSSGFAFDRLNLGNCHAGGERERVTDSVYLEPPDVERLRALACEGVEVFCQALPSEAPHPLCQAEPPGSGEGA